MRAAVNSHTQSRGVEELKHGIPLMVPQLMAASQPVMHMQIVLALITSLLRRGATTAHMVKVE
jgi:hypothetical protein